jgi:hypothetical protein
MTRNLFMGTTLLAAALTASAPQSAGAFRGGGNFHGGGGFHAGGVGGVGGVGGAGGVDGVGGMGGVGGVGGVGDVHADGVNAWHAGGAQTEWGGSWHGDGWHAGGAYANGFQGPAAVDQSYGGGCWNCGAGGIAAGAAAGATIGEAAVAPYGGNPYAIGSVVAGSVSNFVCGAGLTIMR